MEPAAGILIWPDYLIGGVDAKRQSFGGAGEINHYIARLAMRDVRLDRKK